MDETADIFGATPGFSSAWLDRSELRRVKSRLADDVAFGLMISGNLTVESYALARSLAAGAARLGAAIRHENVVGLVASGERVTGIRTDQGMINCDAVVLATGHG